MEADRRGLQWLRDADRIAVPGRGKQLGGPTIGLWLGRRRIGTIRSCHQSRRRPIGAREWRRIVMPGGEASNVPVERSAAADW